MATHKIIIEHKYSGEGSKSKTMVSPPSSTGNNTVQASKALGGAEVNGIANSTEASSASLGKALIGIAITARAVQHGAQIASGTLTRIGEYSGNTLLQNEVDNLFKGLNMAKSFALNPIGATISMAFKRSDFELQKRKNNNEAAYYAAILNGKGADNI